MKRVVFALLALLVLASFSLGVSAHDIPDVNAKGSITISMTYDGDAIVGGTVTAYKVGDIAEDNGNYFFTLADAVKDSGVALDNPQDEAVASALAAFVADNALEGVTAKVDGEGVALFSDIAVGLYLMVQTEAAEGYECAKPFLISVPMTVDGAYIYDVDASPKLSIEKLPESSEESKDEPDLPQTGQTNWPIPLMAVSGLALVVIGGFLCVGKKQKQ